MYNAAVSNKKAVVGNPGTKMPITPIAREMVPKMIRMIFFTVIKFKYWKRNRTRIIPGQK